MKYRSAPVLRCHLAYWNVESLWIEGGHGVHVGVNSRELLSQHTFMDSGATFSLWAFRS